MTPPTDPLLPESLPVRMAGEPAYGTGTEHGLAAGVTGNGLLLGSTGAPAASTTVGLASILQQKWLILGLFLLVSAAAVPPVWLLMRPTFESRAVVQVSPKSSRLVYQTDQNGVVPFYESYLNTQVSVIRSPTVLQRVVDRESVRKTRWYTQDQKLLPGTPTPPLEKLSESISVQPRPRTHLIDVSMTAERAEEAKLIVDAVVDEYLGYVAETGRTEETALIETLRNEQKKREDTIQGYRRRRDERSEPGLFNSEQLRATLGAHLTSLKTRKDDLEREVAMLNWKIDRLKPALPNTTSAPASAPAPAQDPALRFAGDAEWRQLDARCEEAQFALSLARKSLGERSPRVKELVATAEHAERMRQRRESQLMAAPPLVAATQPAGAPPAGTLPDFVDPKVMGELVAAREEEIRLLERDITKQKQEAGTAQELSQLEDLVRHEEEVYNDVSKRLNVLEMESKSPARIEIVAHGLTPSKPSKDRRVLMSLMAVCAAAGCAFAVGYLRALGDSRIQEPRHVQHVTAVPFLGQLPGLRSRDLPIALGGESQTGNPEPQLLATLASCSSSLMEGVRMIRTALLDRLGESRPHILLVTSPMPRSGKSSFVVMLAGSLSQLGRKVLVVEADFYRPSLARRLGLEPTPGLAQLLHGAAGDEDAIARSGVLPFDVLPAGEVRNEQDPELLANGVFSRCLSRWGACYDFILLDAPPVLAVADSRILARHCEGTVMVMRASHDRRGEAVEAYAALTDAGRNVLGTVLIGGQSRAGRGYQGDYYGYGKREAVARTDGDTRAMPVHCGGEGQAGSDGSSPPTAE